MRFLPTFSNASLSSSALWPHQSVQLSEEKATSTMMVSPFIGFIAYSVADGARLLVAHDHRHFEQARRVLSASDFPRSPRPTPA